MSSWLNAASRYGHARRGVVQPRRRPQKTESDALTGCSVQQHAAQVRSHRDYKNETPIRYSLDTDGFNGTMPEPRWERVVASRHTHGDERFASAAVGEVPGPRAGWARLPELKSAATWRKDVAPPTKSARQRRPLVATFLPPRKRQRDDMDSSAFFGGTVKPAACCARALASIAPRRGYDLLVAQDYDRHRPDEAALNLLRLEHLATLHTP
ncbi:hypothetical protein Q5P01_000980 [Channa striata]|uniref:Uncharacterized protein n=1 Tax=Channa striata TaxID=64152 RepID=A0AA88IJD3_CHASR|nr:hypothetical protein Q5P01_000980 [Channa striata]